MDGLVQCRHFRRQPGCHDRLASNVASVNGVTVETEPNLVFSVFVKDNNGCISETVSYEMQVVATPILDITDGLMEDQCSPPQIACKSP